jgi:ABC-type antimicrobial peptide transport system permease subunit
LKRYLGLELHPLSDETRAMVQQNRSVAWMATAFGIFAAWLAMIGVYGVTSYAASQRTREIGIRITLGAQPHNTLRMIVGESAIALAIGIACGIPMARAGAGIIRKLLWGVAPNDLQIFVLAVALMLVVSFFAAFLPARRATQIDPVISLRYE